MRIGLSKEKVNEIRNIYSTTKRTMKDIGEEYGVTATSVMRYCKGLDANVHLPDELETVFISNGKGWTSIGCRVYDRECGWHWAESNGVIYEEKGKIVAECESDDLDVKYWHKLPKPPFA